MRSVPGCRRRQRTRHWRCAGRTVPHGGGHGGGGSEGGLQSCNMGGQAMERDLGSVELCESTTQVALATAGKANCDPTKPLDTRADALLAGRGRGTDSGLGGSEARMTQRKPVQCNNSVLCQSPCSAPHPPPLSAPRRHAVRRGTKRRGRWARPRIAGRRPQKVRVVPIQRTHRRSRKGRK